MAGLFESEGGTGITVQLRNGCVTDTAKALFGWLTKNHVVVDLHLTTGEVREDSVIIEAGAYDEDENRAELWLAEWRGSGEPVWTNAYERISWEDVVKVVVH